MFKVSYYLMLYLSTRVDNKRSYLLCFSNEFSLFIVINTERTQRNILPSSVTLLSDVYVLRWFTGTRCWYYGSNSLSDVRLRLTCYFVQQNNKQDENEIPTNYYIRICSTGHFTHLLPVNLLISGGKVDQQLVSKMTSRWCRQIGGVHKIAHP